MKSLLFIVIISATAGIGVVCAWGAYLRPSRGPRDALLARRFAFHQWLTVICFATAYALSPETVRGWLIVPFMLATLFLLFRFRRRRGEVRNEESYLDPRHRDGFWIKKVL